MLLGNIASFNQGSNQLKFYNRYKIFEPYFQDDWRVTDRLTLNLGLRFSLLGTYRDRYKHAYNWDPAAYDPTQAPEIDPDGSITGTAGALVPGVGNPLDHRVCEVHEFSRAGGSNREARCGKANVWCGGYQFHTDPFAPLRQRRLFDIPRCGKESFSP